MRKKFRMLLVEERMSQAPSLAGYWQERCERLNPKPKPAPEPKLKPKHRVVRRAPVNRALPLAAANLRMQRQAELRRAS